MADKPSAWLNSREASERLGVKLATLYAYASRGLVTSLPGDRQHARLYARDDIERLRTRHAARSGHGPVAASALRFGEPVLETRISDVGPDGPRYRGMPAVELCRAGVSFERVAELLWTGSLPDAPGPAARLSCDAAQLWPLLSGRAALPKMALLLGALALGDGDRQTASDAAEFARARALFHWLAWAASRRAPRRAAAGRVAGTLLAALRVPQNPDLIRNVDRALVLCAEHELNASAFAARVAASAGADLYACLGAAVNTLSGSAHGGVCDRVEALIASIGSKARAERTVRAFLARGDQLPGFGHPLYPNGDPRAAVLLELAAAHGARSEAAKIAFALLAAMRRGGHPAPTLDAGLVTLCHCLELPAGSAASIFAVGRCAGWVAHTLEQRAAGYLLRPRALYLGDSQLRQPVPSE
ncbi:MAG TPA: citrate/2-methylcitrate synthase [Polyangiaceae bacterium]|nr:citrate/2-methylcitrate synthase [Polyangiaceae bacterium]